MRKNLLYIFILFFSITILHAEDCEDDEQYFELELVPDDFPAENSWVLTASDGTTLLSGGAEGAELCFSAGECLNFQISDTDGDGMLGDSYYKLYIDGEEIHYSNGNFGSGESINLNCASGYDCTTATEVTTSGAYVNELNDHWYVYEAEFDGQYIMSTCTNTCNTILYIYDNCSANTFDYDDSNVATIYFSDDECGDQAEVYPILEEGNTYYIRVNGYSDCDATDINWTLSYTGPVTGCTFEEACNFNPLATVDDGSCLEWGSPDCEGGPDLMVLEDVLQSSMYVTTQENTDNCLIEEGCISGYGVRDIIRFTTHIKNIGNLDYYIGPPEPSGGQFEWDPCHSHWHYEGYAEYLMYNEAGESLPIGYKNGFCVLDLECEDGGTYQYGCSNMGISAGCGDIYSSGLQCQWIDITDLEAGLYTLVVRTNWDQSPDLLGHYEPDYSNNWAQACFELSYDIDGNPIMELQDECEPYTDCAGEAYGSAEYDCNGICNGGAVEGDLNANDLLEIEDTQAYINEILADDIAAVPCNDLDADNAITVSDAALVTSCVLYGNDHTHPDDSGLHDHCGFGLEILNLSDTVYLAVSDLNLEEKYIDISIRNPNNKVVAYQFEMDGVSIASVDNLLTDIPIEPENIMGGSTVIAVVKEVDVEIPKNTTAIPLCRVHFTNSTGDFCISDIVDIVNQDFENVIVKVETTEDCFVEDYGVGVEEDQFLESISLYPMPTGGLFALAFESAYQQHIHIELLSVTGQLIDSQRLNAFKGRFEKDYDLSTYASGVYLIKIHHNNGVAVQRVVLK